MRVLLIDVGFGTSDVLLFDSAVRPESQTHLIVPSATQVVAAEIREATRTGCAVVFRGSLMGGGPSTAAMMDHLERGLPFYADPAAGRTFSDDLDEVAGMGVRVVDEAEAARLAAGGAAEVRSGDVRLPDLLQALRLLGEPRAPEGYAVAVQDHGEAPAGVSDRVFRFERFVEILSGGHGLERFWFTRETVPPCFTRMRAAASCLPADAPVVVADTGPAALWGAASAYGGRRCLAVNYGNGHTIASVVEDGAMDGLFEHHTSQLTRDSTARHLSRFAAGDLTDAEVFAEGGHGVLPLHAPLSLEEIPVVVTGPNRARFKGIAPVEVEASLHGDMMLTGCWGLLEGYRARHGAG